MATILSFIKAGSVDQCPNTEIAATESRLLATLHFEDEETVTPTTSPKFGWPLIIYSPENKPSGLAIYYHNYSTWAAAPGICLEELYVVPEYRSHGYAKLLIETIAQKAQDTGCIKLDWLCLRDNQRALRFYEKVGAKTMENWVALKVDQRTMADLARRTLTND